MKGRSLSRDNRGIATYTPYILICTLAVFTLAALLVGEGFGAYEKFWWWDDMLHTVSGVIIGFIGLLMVYFLNARYHMTINPMLVAVFAFTFAITMAVLWEVTEFAIDAVFRANMQRWNLPANAPLIGYGFQGSGLRDTMSDLIVGGIGSLISSIAAYFAYKHRKQAVLTAMRHTFPHIKKRR